MESLYTILWAFHLLASEFSGTRKPSIAFQKFAEEFYKEFEEKFGVKEAKVDDYL